MVFIKQKYEQPTNYLSIQFISILLEFDDSKLLSINLRLNMLLTLLGLLWLCLY